MVKRLLEEPLHGSACPLHQPIVGCPATCRGEAYPDAIVCYSWTDNRLQVAVARTTLIEESATETPDWYLTGKQPKPKGVKIAPSGKRLIWEGLPRTEVLWKVVGSDTFVWATHGVHGVLPSKLVGITTPSMLTGKVEPAAVLNSSIEVKGVATVPEGFELKNLIVRNEDGTWSPAPVLVGPKLVLISAPPVE
jgi:hypothetical protein